MIYVTRFQLAVGHQCDQKVIVEYQTGDKDQHEEDYINCRERSSCLELTKYRIEETV